MRTIRASRRREIAAKGNTKAIGTRVVSRSDFSSGAIAAAAFAALIALPLDAHAQSASSYSAGNMWGTAPSGVSVPGAVDSALAHGQNSATAAAVNAASSGSLIGTGAGGGAVYSIGSQSIVNNTVIGNNNTASIHANQSSSNSGAVSNAGQVGQTNSGNVHSNN